MMSMQNQSQQNKFDEIPFSQQSRELNPELPTLISTNNNILIKKLSGSASFQFFGLYFLFLAMFFAQTTDFDNKLFILLGEKIEKIINDIENKLLPLL